MPNIFDMVTAPAIATYWTETASNRIPYLGEALFPVQKKLGLSLSWIKGYRGLPIALKPSAFDAKAHVRDRIGLSKIETEMPFFRESMKIKEKDRQELLKLQEASSSYYETVIRELFDDRNQLVEGALVQSERMRMQMLLGGKINISADGVDYTYNFDPNGGYASKNTMELTGTDMWSDHDNSNPVEDFHTAMDAVEDKHGTRPTRAIMTRKTWSNLLQNKSIKMDMNVLQGQHIILTDAMLQQYLSAKIGLTVVIYNKKFMDESGAEKSFFTDGYVSLVPDGALGKTWYGTTPEEADLMGGSEAAIEIVETGIAITTIREPHPVNIDTIVSEIVLPSFERMDETFLMKVY